MRILRVYSWGNVGDAILLTPALRRLKEMYPERKLVVYCEKASHREVFANSPYVYALRSLTRWKTVGHKLMRLQVYVAPFGIVRPGIFYNQPAAHIIADMLGIQLEHASPELYLTQDELMYAEETLRDVPRPRVAIHPISTFANKNWLHQRWEEVVKNQPQCSFIQVGMRSEPRIAGTIDLRGTSLRGAFSIIACCAALLGVDSGMVHAATALRIPCVVLFGASSAAVYGHDTNINISANAKVKCSPCLELLFHDACPFANKCMHGIEVSSVGEALGQILGAEP